jgi:hypothetical protein
LYKGTDIDGEILTDMADDLANDKKARDGIATGFPLRKKQQRLPSTWKAETYRGSEVYKISFKPEDQPGGLRRRRKFLLVGRSASGRHGISAGGDHDVSPRTSRYWCKLCSAQISGISVSSLLSKVRRRPLVSRHLWRRIR